MTTAINGVNYAAQTYAAQKAATAPTEKKEETSWFSDWLNDKDKVCTDEADDGSISFSEGLKSFGKGLMGIVKTAINHPIATVATVAGAAALTVATGGAALPVMVAAGATLGTGMIGYGAIKAATAETDGEAKQAWETIGGGTFAAATSALGAKSALSAAANAGVKGAEGAANMSTAQATLQTFKVAPEAIKVSGQNIASNVSSLAKTIGTAIGVTDDVIKAGSAELKAAQPYMSKPNEVQAYRFNPAGTPEEVVANNPGVKYVDGKYAVVDKWASTPDKPAYHFIDPSKEQMIMMYGGDDMAVCDGAIFKGSYVDTAAYSASNTRNYIDPTTLKHGEVINATKQAPGGFIAAKPGTKVQTLEGLKTVGADDVIAIDHNGNPYVTPLKNIAKRNVLSEEAQALYNNLEASARVGIRLKPGMENEPIAYNDSLYLSQIDRMVTQDGVRRGSIIFQTDSCYSEWARNNAVSTYERIAANADIYKIPHWTGYPFLHTSAVNGMNTGVITAAGQVVENKPAEEAK